MSGGFIDTGTFSAGDAGDISIEATTLSLSNGAQIVSSSELASTGRGGNVGVTAGESISISGPNSGLFSTAAGTGAGGEITMAANTITLRDGAKLSASSTGSAEALAGNVSITFGERMSMQHSTISTQSLLADGGNIAIDSTGSVLQLSASQIITSVQSGTGAGGNIILGSQAHPIGFVLLSNSAIQANAFGGPGGNIGIFAGTMLGSGSVITASSELSTPGTINIEARITDVSGSLAQLPDEVLQAATLLRASCAARSAEGQASSLVVARREGVPPQPDGLLWSPLNAALPDRGLSPGGQRNAEMFLPVARLSLGSNCER
jgi:large exoprotein involved in heme utilization and adhesion